MAGFFERDSLFTLTPPGQVGLVMLSLVLSALLLTLIITMARRRRIATRLLLGLGAFALFLWLSPQIYYAYYRIIIDGLPAQWVIRWPPDVAEAIDVLFASERPTLALVGKLLLACASLGAAASAPWIGRRTAPEERMTIDG
ncbi:MAG: hypothetical protein AAF334_09420 [Pseudomonadota bacterium]